MNNRADECIYGIVQFSANGSDDGFLLRTYAASADPAAFAELVRRYADMVYATARRVTGNPSAAEDVAQDCFLRMAENSAAISGSLAGWLHRASLNRSLELIRSERARRRREVDAAAAAAASTSAKGDAAELVAKVDEGLATLPDELRAVVTEHFLLGRGQKEIAAQLGLSQPTVSRRIERGLLQLRLWLAAEGVVLSAIAMPAMLVEVTRDTAPATLPSTLAKIGLSGVRRPAVIPKPAGPSMTILYTAAAAIFVAGISAWFALQPEPARPTPAAVSKSPAPATTTSHVERGEREMKIPLAQVPEEPRETLIEAAQGAKIDAVDKQVEDGKAIYEIDVPIAGKSYEIRVAEDGTLISKKPE